MISNSQILSPPSQHEPLVSSSNDQHETLNHLFSSYNSHSTSLLYNLSILKEKLHQIQSVVNVVVSNYQTSTECPPPPLSPISTATINSLTQELIMAASSMLFTSQQMNNHLVVNPSLHNDIVDNELHGKQHNHGQGLDESYRSIILYNTVNGHHYNNNWYDATTYNNNNNNNSPKIEENTRMTTPTTTTQDHQISIDIIEFDASDLLAKYTHYCEICGKGFKRDANLRMHMRAHGDEYKASGALSNREKRQGRDAKMGTKYSCPQEGCRWNQKHVKFQPLKSLICVKNHYKRTHCPKMYVCKLCSRKNFSVLSDLRTHEKHCGDVKWLCSCGTTFSRKDKLMGHVELFVGHAPAVGLSTRLSGNL